MNWLELSDYRKRLLATDLPASEPIPQYWERDVPPGVKTFGDYLDRFGGVTEAEAAANLKAWLKKDVVNRWGITVPILAIVTNEPWGDYTDPSGKYFAGANRRFETSIGGAASNDHVAFYRFSPVAAINVMQLPRVLDFEGELVRHMATVYEAVSVPYDMPEVWNGKHDGRKGVTDSCRSGPERYSLNGDGVEEFGAATALLARLLEVATT